MIKIWSDGACRGNNNKENIGAWAFYSKDIPSGSGVKLNTTNNEMEIIAILKALYVCVKGDVKDEIVIYSDSAYCVSGFNKWMEGWKKRGWRKSDKKVIENLKWWKFMYEIKQRLNVKLVKVKGHSGEKDGNYHADKMANDIMDKYLKGE